MLDKKAEGKGSPREEGHGGEEALSGVSGVGPGPSPEGLLDSMTLPRVRRAAEMVEDRGLDGSPGGMCADLERRLQERGNPGATEYGFPSLFLELHIIF